jgi:hypothetical protein
MIEPTPADVLPVSRCAPSNLTNSISPPARSRRRFVSAHSYEDERRAAVERQEIADERARLLAPRAEATITLP